MLSTGVLRVPCQRPIRALRAAPRALRGGAHGGRAGFSLGSHDTMTYSLNRRCPISHTQSPLLQLLARVLPCVTQPAVLKWSVTQVSAPRAQGSGPAPSPCLGPQRSPEGKKWNHGPLQLKLPRWGGRQRPSLLQKPAPRSVMA